MLDTKRRKTGSAIAEFGPSLFILLILVLFPMIDLLSLTAGYAYCWLLNSAEVRELSVNAPANAAAAIQKVDRDFLSLGWAGFLGVTPAMITHQGPTYQNSGTATEVNLKTMVSVKPFIFVPLPIQIPGVSARLSFSFDSSVAQEENAKN